MMGRRARAFYTGLPTHLTARGVDDQPLFRSDLDRYELLALLRKTTERVGWHVLCWCLMTTHYHLLVVVPDGRRVSWAMQVVNSVYAREFNSRHRRRGALFGNRFADTLVESDPQCQRTIAYILENPVRAGFVKEIEDWPWSGLQTLRARDEVDTLSRPTRNIPVRLGG
jgi:putative transposase